MFPVQERQLSLSSFFKKKMSIMPLGTFLVNPSGTNHNCIRRQFSIFFYLFFFRENKASPFM